jgi:mannose/cellobiose epimerase-like protein (N-acyl-D-glucosamine 2-epimerase family)
MPNTAWLAEETSRLLDDAARSRDETGGFRWLAADGTPDLTRGRQLWINARMTHLFSLGTLLGRPADHALADHGVDALTGLFRDPDHDGWYATIGDDGPLTTSKTAYEHAFVLLAASSAVVAERPGAAALLDAAISVVDRYFWDDDAGASVEEWNRDWTVLDGYRGANANMHSLEAYLAVADATGDPRWRSRGLRIASRLVHDGARTHGWRVPEHFDDSWQVVPDYNRDIPDHPFRPYGITPGHGIEWARLILVLGAALGPAAPSWIPEAAAGLFDTAVREGWATGPGFEADSTGGFVYTTDFDGRPVVTERFHWVLCEAIGTASALHRVTGEQRYADWHERFWDFARASYIAPALADGGVGWQHEVSASGAPTSRTWVGRPDFYHAVQATLIPRLPLAPTLATALREGLLDA